MQLVQIARTRPCTCHSSLSLVGYDHNRQLEYQTRQLLRYCGMYAIFRGYHVPRQGTCILISKRSLHSTLVVHTPRFTMLTAFAN